MASLVKILHSSLGGDSVMDRQMDNIPNAFFKKSGDKKVVCCSSDWHLKGQMCLMSTLAIQSIYNGINF